jgi:hypothetical protein
MFPHTCTGGEVDGLAVHVLRVGGVETRVAPATEPTEEGRTLRGARQGSAPPAGAHGVLVANGGERLVEEEEHGQHLAPETGSPHRADGASYAA